MDSVLPITQEVNGANNIVHLEFSLLNYSDSYSKRDKHRGTGSADYSDLIAALCIYESQHFPAAHGYRHT